MSMWKVKVMILVVSVVFVGYARAADSLMYDDFESYADTAALNTVWHAFDAYNPALPMVLNTDSENIVYDGDKCMELTSYLKKGTARDRSDGWGVELGQKAMPTDVSMYSTMTAWVMIGQDATDSQTWDGSFELRDTSGLVIGSGAAFDFGAEDYNWDWIQVSLNLDGPGDKTNLSQVLIWFDCDPFTSRTFPAGVAQMYVDDIEFNTPEPATLAILGLGGLLLRRRK
jgi:hypothetical protein